MAEENQEQPEQQKGISVQKVYIKDASLEVPGAPQIFQDPWNPDADVQLGTASKKLGEGVFEVVLTVTVTTKIEEKTAFLVEIKQAGVFGVQGFDEQELSTLLGSFCPGILFPYAREAVSDLVGKAGFPQLLLQPVNFDALYAQHMQQQAEAAGKAH